MSEDLGTATPHAAAYLLVRKDGLMAFVLRSNTTWMNGHYGPPSGKVEKGESYTAGAVREAKEEVGIDVDPADLTLAHVMHRNEGRDWVDMYFEVAKWEGEPYNAEPHMHSELAWLDPKNLPDNTIASVRFAIEQIEKGNIFSEYGWDV